MGMCVCVYIYTENIYYNIYLCIHECMYVYIFLLKK